MSKIKIPMLKTPESFAMKYVASKIGFNVRPSKTTYDPKNDSFTVTLKAIVPSLVKLNENESKTFVYTFEDVAKAVIKNDKYDFDFIEKPKAPELDLELIKKFDKLTSDLQNEILVFGEKTWGTLTSVKYWLNPLRGIIIRTLSKNEFDVENATPRYKQYFEFLDSAGWINYIKSSKPKIKITNKLKALHHLSVSDTRFNDVSSVSDLVIGSLYAHHFNEIRDELRIFGPDVYVTATKAYYADAVREGQSIPMSQYRLWLKYRSYNYHPRPNTNKEYSFPTVVSELVHSKFLQFSDDEKYITANPELLKKVLPHREKLSKLVIEI